MLVCGVVANGIYKIVYMCGIESQEVSYTGAHANKEC